jgi:hypothetical protein
MSDLVEGRAVSFSEIAQREGKVERQGRFLTPLAFLSPRLVSGPRSSFLSRICDPNGDEQPIQPLGQIQAWIPAVQRQQPGRPCLRPALSREP